MAGAKGRRDGEGEAAGGLQRIGLSATQRPLERIASFLVGPGRECRIVDAGKTKELDLEIVVPVEDMSDPGSSGTADVPGRPAEGMPSQHTSPERVDPNFDGASNPRSIWPAIYPELLRLVREHTSTIIFVNNRRGAERLAKRLNELANEQPEQELPATEQAGHDPLPEPAAGEDAVEIARAHHGSLSHEERINVEELLKSGRAAVPGRDFLAGAGDRHGCA